MKIDPFSLDCANEQAVKSFEVVSVSEAIKSDKDKNRLDLWPAGPYEEIGWALTHGATKYGDYNWAKGMKWSRLYAAALRHLIAWWRGENKDPESGLSHLAHAACCLIFLLQLEKTKQQFDDRPKD
jgi:hypothetical protein